MLYMYVRVDGAFNPTVHHFEIEMVTFNTF